MPLIMIHSAPCGEPLDKSGRCPKCEYSPRPNSSEFAEVDTATLIQKLSVERRSFLGQFRAPIDRSGEQPDSDE